MPEALKTARASHRAAAKRATRGDRIARAYEQLRDLIISGRLAPGSRIIESDIAERLGVSRTPVRSALHRLQQEGYITGVGRQKEQRLVIAPLTQEDARELFEIIGAIEGLAARDAAAVAPPQRGALVAQLHQINVKLSEASRPGHPDPLRIFDLDMSFHRRYVEAGAGPRLLALHDAIKPQAERYVRLYTSALVDEIGRSVTEHDAIIEKIDAANADAAQRSVERNWRNAAVRLSKVIASLGERGSW
ncbi:MAG TPA: GntR family transcriptional regulator [Gemmatimonadaceae bacterium]|jgi:DNA-binding GntR family transcriptional regulator